MTLAETHESIGVIAGTFFVLLLGFAVVGGLFYAMVYKPSRDEKAAAPKDEAPKIEDDGE